MVARRVSVVLGMRISGYLLLLLLVGFSTATPVCAETTIYLLGHVVFVPAFVVLLVVGLALLAVGGWLKKRHRD
jgi:hypothetical protein